MKEKPVKSMAEFLAVALDGATGEGAISVHVRGDLVLLTESRLAGEWDDTRYNHKLASWHRDLTDCERRGHHEYAMIYNDGTTCLDCDYHRPAGEESGEIRSISGVVVPSLLCDLARALPMKCDPSHEPRENPAICKACDESRDELQQLVGDGDLNAIAIVIGVYLRRLYAEHEKIATDLEFLRAYWEVKKYQSVAHKVAGLYETSGVLEMIFGEVLTDEDRGVPSDDEAVRMVKAMVGDNLSKLNLTDLCECGHTLYKHGERTCGVTHCPCRRFRKEVNND
jgi:hypothetical protein